jgi:hypothetical protein
MGIKGHEAMLLAGNADPLDAAAVDLGSHPRDHPIERGGPVSRMLLEVPAGSPGINWWGARASATTLRASRSRATALTLCVPESIPMKSDMGRMDMPNFESATSGSPPGARFKAKEKNLICAASQPTSAA